MLVVHRKTKFFSSSPNLDMFTCKFSCFFVKMIKIKVLFIKSFHCSQKSFQMFISLKKNLVNRIKMFTKGSLLSYLGVKLSDICFFFWSSQSFHFFWSSQNFKCFLTPVVKLGEHYFTPLFFFLLELVTWRNCLCSHPTFSVHVDCFLHFVPGKKPSPLRFEKIHVNRKVVCFLSPK